MTRLLLATFTLSQIIVLFAITFVTLEPPSTMLTDAWTSKERGSYLFLSLFTWGVFVLIYYTYRNNTKD